MPLDCPLSVAHLQDLAEQYGTPFQLYDEQGIRRTTRKLFAAFRGAGFDGFRQYFAVKALPNPAILSLLLDEGCGLDCSSATELYTARRLGVDGSRVMFTSNFTSEDDLRFAFEMGATINLDDLSLLASCIRACGACPDRLCFRLNPGVGRTDSATTSNLLGGPQAKFGVPPDQIVEAYRQAKAAGATRFGLHMMTGSCVLEPEYWRQTVTVLLETLARVRAEVGIEFEFINIGGGLGIPYRPEQQPLDLREVALTIRQTVDAAVARGLVPAHRVPQLCMENGRFLTGPHGWLVARCVAEKRAFGLRYFGLDACMANLMRPGMYGAYHHITVPTKQGTRVLGGAAQGSVGDEAVEAAEAVVVGSLCENNDKFTPEPRRLPLAAPGDLFALHDTGAHAFAMGFQYNGKLRAPELLIRQNAARQDPSRPAVDLIRWRERPSDLLANTVVPRDLGGPVSFGGPVGADEPQARGCQPKQQASPPPTGWIRVTLAVVVGALVGAAMSAALVHARR